MTAFTVYPAIDVREGRVVRLAQGDYARQTTYGNDPLDTASRYAAQGAKWLHLVDLDAAKAGGYTLSPLLREICAFTGLKPNRGCRWDRVSGPPPAGPRQPARPRSVRR